MTLEERVLRHRLAVIQRAAALGNVSQACREFGISRMLFYRWRQRFVRYGRDGLRPRPTRPTRWPRQATPALEHAVVACALLWPTHGPARIARPTAPAPVGRLAGEPIWTYAILCRHGLRTRWERLTRLEAHRAVTLGLLTERTRKRLRHPHVGAHQPGDLVCIDAFYIGKLKGVGKVWQLTACLELGIEHRRTKPRHAWTNGFVERLQGTILAELWRVAFRRTYYTSLAQLERDLQAYLRFYNRERPHLGYRLKGCRPAMLFKRNQVAQLLGLGWSLKVQTPSPNLTC